MAILVVEFSNGGYKAKLERVVDGDTVDALIDLGFDTWVKKRIRYKGIVCDRCGVEVTEKKVRRDRVGHINLVVPVAHIWYFKSLPNKIGYLLGLPSKKLDMIIYYERYVVIQPGEAKNSEGELVNKMDFLTEEEYLTIMETLPADNQFLDDSDVAGIVIANFLLVIVSRLMESDAA